MTETEQTLRQRFTAFLQAMYDWETEANRVDEEEVEKKKTLSWEDFCKQQTELRIPIYKEYITERERKYGGAEYTSHVFPHSFYGAPRWNQGYQEHYRDTFLKYWDSLSPEAQQEYMDKYHCPEDWRIWHKERERNFKP